MSTPPATRPICARGHEPGGAQDSISATSRGDGIIVCDGDSFTEANLHKAEYKTSDPVAELGIDPKHIMLVPMTTLLKSTLADTVSTTRPS